MAANRNNAGGLGTAKTGYYTESLNQKKHDNEGPIICGNIPAPSTLVVHQGTLHDAGFQSLARAKTPEATSLANGLMACGMRHVIMQCLSVPAVVTFIYAIAIFIGT